MELSKSPLKFLWFIVKKNRKCAVLAILAVTFAVTMQGGLLLLIRELTNAANNAVNMGFTPETLRSLWFWVIIFPVSFFATESVWRLSGFSGMRLITKSESEVSRNLFRYLIDHSRTYFNKKFSGALVNKIGHASKGVHKIFAAMLWHYYPLFMGTIIDLVIVISIDYSLGLMLGLWMIVFIGINYLMVRKKQHLSFAAASANSTMKGKMVDTVTNIEVVHTNAYHRYERRYVDKYIKEYQKIHLRSWMASEWILFLNGFLLACFAIGMISITIILMKNGQAGLGSLVLIITLVVNLMRDLFFLGSTMTDTIDDYSQIEEGLQEILVPYHIIDRSGAKHIKTIKGNINFKNVFFNFGKTPIFDKFSLKIKAGQKLGIVGVSGAGKTTLANLLMRHHEVDKGQIVIDNNDIRDITRESLRGQIAFVPQDVSLFHRTVMENIKYGSLKATKEEVIEASKKAQAHEFVKSFPHGYETYVGERGVKLSGGQRQRIAIARAFLKKAPILLLDEATSALDSESEMLVQAALTQLIQQKTVIAIAHRLSTLRVMDRIVVLQNGKVVEDGTHASLLKEKGIYANLWNHQVEGFIE